MSDEIQISVSIPLDEGGMVGRECLECKKYFKIKPGTGLPTTYCHCPYCDYEGDSNTFWTPAQIEYAKSIAINKAYRTYIKPAIDDLIKSFKELERNSRNSLIQFKVTTTGNNYSLPIKYYSEKELETKLTCDNCGCVFSIYGVFARCPDCNELNAFLIYEKSIEVTVKQFTILTNADLSPEIAENSYGFILSSCISTFDALGKELRKRKPTNFPDKPKNLFQNLHLLNEILGDYLSTNHKNFPLLLKMFQVRHLYEHNMGVIDQDFITKTNCYHHMLGRKYLLTKDELESFITAMRELGELMKELYKSLK